MAHATGWKLAAVAVVNPLKGLTLAGLVLCMAQVCWANGDVTASTTTLTLQTDATVTLTLSDTTDKRPRTLHVETTERRSALFARQVELREGRADFSIFPRREGPLELFVYDPLTKKESFLRFHVERRDNVGVEVMIETQEGASLVRTFDQIRLGATFTGAQTPRTVQLSVRDSRGRRIYSRFYDAAAMGDTRTRFAIPTAGWCDVEVIALAEDLSKFPTGSTVLPTAYPRPQRTNPLHFDERETTPGLSEVGVMGARVVLENLPTTATILGRDRFPLIAIAVPPIENRLYKSLFGLNSGHLFDESLQSLGKAADTRLRRQYRVGSRWAREHLRRDIIEPKSGNFTWSQADSAVRAYRGLKYKLVGVLDVPVRTSSDDGVSSDSVLNGFRQYVKNIGLRYGEVAAFEFDSTESLRAGDARLLAEVASEELKKLKHPAQLVLRAPGKQDGEFFDAVLGDNPTTAVTVLAIGMTPEDARATPEELQIPERIQSLKDAARRHKVSDSWMTDAGWSVSPDGVTEAEQANYLARLYTLNSFRRVKTFWSRVQDTAPLPWRAGADASTGLFDSMGQPKRSAGAYSMIQFILSQVNPQEIKTVNNVVLYSFESIISESKWPGHVYAAWTPKKGERGEVTVTVGPSGCFGVDYLGAQVAPLRVSPPYSRMDDEPTTRTVTFVVDERPLFIWEIGEEVKGMQPPPNEPNPNPRVVQP